LMHVSGDDFVLQGYGPILSIIEQRHGTDDRA